MPKILIIDDEFTIVENLRFILELENFDVLFAYDGLSGIDIFNNYKDSIDVVLTDMKMPKMSGIEVLKSIKAIYPEMSVIILTGHGDMQNAIDAMKEDAFDYLNKPVNVNELLLSLNNAIEKKNLLLENAKLEKQIFEKNEYLINIHNSAQKILLNLIPKNIPDIKDYNFYTKYIPCEEVSGDMYDVFDLDDFFCFYVCDVSSHGILASVITIIIKSLIENIKYLKTIYRTEADFCNLIADLNNRLCLNTLNNTFATMFIGLIKKQTNMLYYISAGHVDQYIIKQNELIHLDSTGPILGAFENAVYECGKYQIDDGDKILLFTDGIIEVWYKNEIFGSNNVENIIKKNINIPVNLHIENIFNSASEFSNKNFCDDITILGIEKSS